jgi:hypothetical protein
MSVQELSFQTFVNRVGKVPIGEVTCETKTHLYLFFFGNLVSLVLWAVFWWPIRMLEKPTHGAVGHIADYAIPALLVLWGLARRKELFAYLEGIFSKLKQPPLWVLCYFVINVGAISLVGRYIPWACVPCLWAGSLFAHLMETLYERGMELESDTKKVNDVGIVA